NDRTVPLDHAVPRGDTIPFHRSGALRGTVAIGGTGARDRTQSARDAAHRAARRTTPIRAGTARDAGASRESGPAARTGPTHAARAATRNVPACARAYGPSADPQRTGATGAASATTATRTAATACATATQSRAAA